MKISKALVFANVFISIGLLAWAISIYTNRLNYFDGKEGETAVPGRFTQNTAELKRLTDGIQLAQSRYVAAMDQLVFMELDRDYRNQVLRILMNEVRNQGVPNALFRNAPREDITENRGLIDVRRYNEANPFPPRLNLRNQPLQGFGTLQQKMTNLLKDEKDRGEQINKYRTDANKLSLEIYDKGANTGLQPEVFKMKTILKNLGDEELHLADAQVNWEEQLRTLKIRKQQLTTRLAELSKPTSSGSGGQE